jgi:enoyl-CoA hydratase
VTNYRYLTVSLEKPAAIIVLRSHTLKLELLAELRDAVRSVGHDRLIITGQNGFFAAGADIAELRALTGPEALEYARFGQSVLNEIVEHPAVTVAAMDGWCMGGGLDLALACDLRYASPKSVLAHPGGRIGIMTGWSGTQRLPLIIGKSRALEMMTVGCRLTAGEAWEWGLVNGVTEDPLKYALEEPNNRNGR